MRSAWETFVTRHQLQSIVPPMIAQSWKRCWPRLDPYQRPILTRLAADHLLSTQVANFELLSVARPIMEDIHQYIEKSDTVITLVNNAGYILDMLGDLNTLEIVRGIGIENGISLSENQIGTNAFALAILERIPVQVNGSEHYLEPFHQFAETAAPIFDLTGNPLGAFGLINLSHQIHPHSLGLVVAGARAIEGQRQSDHLLDEQNRQLTGLNAILSSIDEGILVWNPEGILLHANTAANHILDASLDRLTGEAIFQYVQFPTHILDSIRKNEILSDVEATLVANEHHTSCVMSLRYIPGSRSNQRTIAILRRTKEIRQLVQRQLGAHASITLENLVGKSPEMRRVRRVAQTAAAARASILVRGESGTGKNLLARAIHNQGPQREGPFIVFACTSIPGELVMVELAGVQEDHISGQASSRPSKLELADGGTIFFKDVEALPLDAQTVLLNFLEMGFVQRLGSQQPIEVQVRVIASTSEDLDACVREGSFRPDLYYRLSPFEIHIPPLREHIADLPLLIESILDRINRYQIIPIRVTPKTLEVMQRYDWPGNIREVEGALERAIVQSGAERIILPEHLPEHIRLAEKHAGKLKALSMEEVERDTILKAARACKGNLSHMARALGIGRTTVWRRLKKLDITIDQFRGA